jgi:hypothetical protein
MLAAESNAPKQSQLSLWDLLPGDERFATNASRPPAGMPQGTWPEKLFAILFRHFESERSAVEFMRFAAGCVLEVPPAELVEQFVVERSAARRLRLDPSQAAVNHLADAYGAEKRAFAKIHTRHNGLALADDRQMREDWAKHCKEKGMTCRAIIGSRHPRIVIARMRVSV